MHPEPVMTKATAVKLPAIKAPIIAAAVGLATVYAVALYVFPELRSNPVTNPSIFLYTQFGHFFGAS
jgi:hypothetical protein